MTQKSRLGYKIFFHFLWILAEENETQIGPLEITESPTLFPCLMSNLGSN